MRKIVLVGLLMALTVPFGVSAVWADAFGLGGDTFDTLVGTTLTIGLNHDRGTFGVGTDPGGLSGSLSVGLLVDWDGAGPNPAADFLAGSPNHFDFFSMHTVQTGLKVVKADAGVFTDDLGMSFNALSDTTGPIYHYIWNGTPIPVTGGTIDYTRELFWDSVNPFFTMKTTILNNTAPGGEDVMTDIHYGEGLDPNPDEPTTASTANFTIIGALSGTQNQVYGQGSIPFSQYLGLNGVKGTPSNGSNATVQSTHITDPKVLYLDALGANHVPFGDGTLNMALTSADKNPQGAASDTIDYRFGQGEVPGTQTPELGTFLLLGLSMLPIGVAIRRRRKN